MVYINSPIFYSKIISNYDILNTFCWEESYRRQSPSGFREVGGYQRLMQLYLTSGYFPKRSNKTKYRISTTSSPPSHFTTSFLTSGNDAMHSTENIAFSLTSNTTALRKLTAGLRDETTTHMTPMHTAYASHSVFNTASSFEHSTFNTPTNLLLELMVHLSNSTNTAYSPFLLTSSPMATAPNLTFINSTHLPTINLSHTTKFADADTDASATYAPPGITKAIVYISKNRRHRRNNTACGYPPPNSFHVLRGVDDDVFPWPGLFTLTVMSVWYWCSDQVGWLCLDAWV